MKKLIYSLCLILISMSLHARYPASGNPLKSNTEDSIAMFPLPGITAMPVGVAYLKGREMPTLFLSADNWYPGFYRHDCLAYKDGAPVFGDAIDITMPSGISPALPGSILEDKGVVYGYWLKNDTLIECRFEDRKNIFKISRRITVQSLPRPAASILVIKEADELVLFLEVSDGIPINGPIHWEQNKNFAAHGADGLFVGNFSYAGIYGGKTSFKNPDKQIDAKPLTEMKEVMWSYQKMCRVKYDDSHQGILTGSQNGNFLYYKTGKNPLELSVKSLVPNRHGIAIRHTTIWARPTPFLDKQNKQMGLIVSGEGGIYYYKYLSLDKKGVPVYSEAEPLLAKQPEVYAGSLVVPNLVDWDNDGDLDMIVGNSIGYILFYENKGTDESPAFGIPQYLKAGGEVIWIQPGYSDDIQGPFESRWGYSCPAVVDWNGDGLPDIVMNDSRGKHRLFLNIGTLGHPVLAVESPLYLDGLEYKGTWRTRPGAGLMGDRMAYITQDAQDQFHIYWQLDTYNLIDGGKLTLEDGSYIDGSYFPNGGGSGRTKFLIVDWDGDGVKDILAGTPRYGSIPNKQNGMPYYQGNKGAAAVFLKNMGTEQKPVFAYPKMLKYKGETIHFGQHSCAPSVGDLGIKNGLDLIVGTQMGRIYFYERSDLSW